MVEKNIVENTSTYRHLLNKMQRRVQPMLNGYCLLSTKVLKYILCLIRMQV